jgi:hypothetical protein
MLDFTVRPARRMHLPPFVQLVRTVPQVHRRQLCAMLAVSVPLLDYRLWAPRALLARTAPLARRRPILSRVQPVIIVLPEAACLRLARLALFRPPQATLKRLIALPALVVRIATRRR